MAHRVGAGVTRDPDDPGESIEPTDSEGRERSPKITLEQYRALLDDPETPDAAIVAYSRVVSDEARFEPRLVPDPARVVFPVGNLRAESALSFGNGVSRFRRRNRFRNSLAAGIRRPVLLSEGDSWFQFPWLIHDVVDHLRRDYLIWSMGAAGDTAQNMVFGPEERKRREFVDELRDHRDSVRAFLFSGAGNDIIGEDRLTGEPVLASLLRPSDAGRDDPAAYLDPAALEGRLEFLERAYRQVIDDVRAIEGLERLPIVVHGYDYVYPHPAGDADQRDPSYVRADKWLGGPMRAAGIGDPGVQRAIAAHLIDVLHDLLERVRTGSGDEAFLVVDCRGTLPDLDDWNDEIHPTSEGFAKISTRFRTVIDGALGSGALA